MDSGFRLSEKSKYSSAVLWTRQEGHGGERVDVVDKIARSVRRADSRGARGGDIGRRSAIPATAEACGTNLSDDRAVS